MLKWVMIRTLRVRIVKPARSDAWCSDMGF